MTSLIRLSVPSPPALTCFLAVGLFLCSPLVAQEPTPVVAGEVSGATWEAAIDLSGTTDAAENPQPAFHAQTVPEPVVAGMVLLGITLHGIRYYRRRMRRVSREFQER